MLYGFQKKLDPNRITTALLAAAVCITQFAHAGLSQESSTASVHTGRVSAGYQGKHPKLHKLAKAAALGALTGGVGTLFLGGSLVTHALVGAGVHTGISATRDSKVFKKHQQDKQRAIAERNTSGGGKSGHGGTAESAR